MAERKFSAAVPIISTIGSIITSWFGTKQEAVKATTSVFSTAADVLTKVDSTDGQIAAAASAIAVAQFNNEGSFTKIIRGTVILLMSIAVVAWCFGYVPSNINQPMPPFIAECFEVVKLGLGLYIPARSVEKIARMIMTPKLVQTITDKIMRGV